MTNTTQYYLNQGITKHNNDDYAGAIEDFNKAIELDPNNALAYYRRGRAKSWVNQDYLEDYRKSVELDPTFVEVYDLIADQLLWDGEIDEPEQLYKKALEIDPNFIDGYFGMARICLFKDDKEGAEEYASKAVGVNPTSERTYQFRAWLRHLNGNLIGALNDINKSLEITSENISALQLRGDIKYESRDFLGAIKDFTKVIEIDSYHSHAYYLRGLCKCQLSDLNGGLDDLNQAIAINPDEWFFYSRGVVLLILEKHELSKHDFDRAIKLYSKFEEVYPYRGVSRYLLSDKAGARRDWKKSGMNTKEGIAFMKNVLSSFDFDNLY